MYCVQCGVELQKGAKACPLCGLRVYHPDLQETPEDTDKDPIQTEDAQAGRMSGMMRKRKTGERRSANGSSSRLPPL